MGDLEDEDGPRCKGFNVDKGDFKCADNLGDGEDLTCTESNTNDAGLGQVQLCETNNELACAKSDISRALPEQAKDLGGKSMSRCVKSETSNGNLNQATLNAADGNSTLAELCKSSNKPECKELSVADEELGWAKLLKNVGVLT